MSNCLNLTFLFSNFLFPIIIFSTISPPRYSISSSSIIFENQKKSPHGTSIIDFILNSFIIVGIFNLIFSVLFRDEPLPDLLF